MAFRHSQTVDETTEEGCAYSRYEAGEEPNLYAQGTGKTCLFCLILHVARLYTVAHQRRAVQA